MNMDFKIYLESIGIGELFTKRVEDIYLFYSEILKKMNDEIRDIFITEYIKQDGSRQYDSLWFFSDKYFMEAKMFSSKDDFDFMPYACSLTYLRIEKQDYDFKKATEQSRLIVEYEIPYNKEGVLKASKGNCDKLREITIKYFIPNTK